MLPFNFYLQKLVCKQKGTKEIRFWKLDMEGLWTVQPQESWVMKNIIIVIKIWFQETFSCLREVGWKNNLGYTWQVLGEGQNTVEEWFGLNFLCTYFYMHVTCFLEGCVLPSCLLSSKSWNNFWVITCGKIQTLV